MPNLKSIILFNQDAGQKIFLDKNEGQIYLRVLNGPAYTKLIAFTNISFFIASGSVSHSIFRIPDIAFSLETVWVSV